MRAFDKIKEIAERAGWRATYSDGIVLPPHVVFTYKENRILIKTYPDGSLLKNFLHIKQHLWKHFSNFDETEAALLTIDDNLTSGDMKEYRMAEQTLYEAFDKMAEEERKAHQNPKVEE